MSNFREELSVKLAGLMNDVVDHDLTLKLGLLVNESNDIEFALSDILCHVIGMDHRPLFDHLMSEEIFQQYPNIINQHTAQDSEGDTATAYPLYTAIMLHPEYYVEQLIIRGANINDPHSKNTATPLLIAVIRDESEGKFVQALISARADVNFIFKGNSCLSRAITLNKHAAIKALKKAGARQTEALEVLKLLYPTLASNTHYKTKVTPTIEKETNWSAEDILSYALIEAIKHRDEQLFDIITSEEMLAKYPNIINQRVIRGEEHIVAYPLYEAVINNLENFVRRLLELDVLVNQPHLTEKSSPLFEAARECTDNDIVELLIEYKANVHFKLEDTLDTPLHEATVAKNVRAIRVLKKAGARVDAECSDGETPLDLAIETGDRDVMGAFDILEESDSDSSAPADPQSIVNYKTVTISDRRHAKLIINNADQKYDADLIAILFTAENFNAPEIELDGDDIVLDIKYRPYSQSDYLPKDTKLTDAIYVLAKNGLLFSEEGQQNLKDAYEIVSNEIKAKTNQIKFGQKGGIFITLTPYQNAFGGLEDFFEKDTTKEELVTPQPSPLNASLIDLFDNLLSSTDIGNLQVNSDAMQEHNDNIRTQWSAYKLSTPTVSDTHLATFIEPIANAEINGDAILDIKNLSQETKHALQNIIFYGAKLVEERKNISHVWKNKIQQLNTKIEAAQNFITHALSQEELSEESIKEAYNDLQQNDVNRTTGFYRIHSFFAGKRYIDENEKSRLVKSTFGELAHDFVQTLVK